MHKKIISDVILSIIASIIPVAGLQLILLPLVALKTTPDEYGRIITIIALINLSAATLGNVLNNSRLILNNHYEKAKLKGDFNTHLLNFSLINLAFVIFGLLYYDHPIKIFNYIILIISSLLLLVKGYATVEFRIKLNYKLILGESIVLVSGYFIGYLIFLITHYWQFIYLFGFASSFLFVYKKTYILREPLQKTILFKKNRVQTYSLLFSGLLLSLGTYIDKLLLFPLLGGEIVAVYFAASILGKTIAMIMQPITGVILSYLAPKEEISQKNFIHFFLLTTIAGIIGYTGILIISKPVLTIMYPQYVTESLKYIGIITAGIIILLLSNLVNAFLLKFLDLKWQIYINSSYIFIYILFSITLIKPFGLWGFCLGILTANTIKLVFMLCVYYFKVLKL